MAAGTHELARERHWVCARRMCERRHELGLTQYDVVQRLVALGVSASNRTLSAMEHGQGVDVGRLPELASSLDCTVTYLLGLTADPNRWAPDDATVVLSEPRNGASVPADRASWILGPDVPDRGVVPSASRHA